MPRRYRYFCNFQSMVSSQSGHNGVFVHVHVALEDVQELVHAHILPQGWVVGIVKESPLCMETVGNCPVAVS